jgi:hypothetical protein
MAAPVKFAGFSQTTYEYTAADLNNLAALPTQGGNFIFAKREGGAPVIVFAGETNTLKATLAKHPRWREAQNKHGAIFLFFHLNTEPSRRRLELHDLVRRYSPPMNAAANVEYEE